MEITTAKLEAFVNNKIDNKFKEMGGLFKRFSL